MTSNILSEYLPGVIQIAQQAGKKILDISLQEGVLEVRKKSDGTPITFADMAAHEIVKSGLFALTPMVPLISEEESEDITFEERKAWDNYWLVDPLDGTLEFIRESGQYCVCIAYIHQQQPVLGVIYIPEQEVCYYAVKGAGAYKQPNGEAAVPIHVRHCPDKPVLICGRSTRNKYLQLFRDAMPEHAITQIGSAIKCCYVAEGRADVYPSFGPTMEWDTAAAQCILQEAGGSISDVFGEPLRYNQRPSFRNPRFLALGKCALAWADYLKACNFENE